MPIELSKTDLLDPTTREALLEAFTELDAGMSKEHVIDFLEESYGYDRRESTAIVATAEMLERRIQ